MCSWEFGGSRRRARGARGDHRFFLSYTVWAARPRGRASLVTQYGFLSHTRSSERASLVTHGRGRSESGARSFDDASGDSPPPFTGTCKQARLSRAGGQGPRNRRFAGELGASCLEARYAARMEYPATPASGSAIGSLYGVNRSAGRLATWLDELNTFLQNWRGRRPHVVKGVHDPPVALVFGSCVEQVRGKSHALVVR
jgi:hypothetical protein